MVAVNAATSFEVNGEVRVGAIVRRDKAKAGFAFRTDEAFFFSAFFSGNSALSFRKSGSSVSIFGFLTRTVFGLSRSSGFFSPQISGISKKYSAGDINSKFSIPLRRSGIFSGNLFLVSFIPGRFNIFSDIPGI